MRYKHDFKSDGHYMAAIAKALLSNPHSVQFREVDTSTPVTNDWVVTRHRHRLDFVHYEYRVIKVPDVFYKGLYLNRHDNPALGKSYKNASLVEGDSRDRRYQGELKIEVTDGEVSNFIYTPKERTV